MNADLREGELELLHELRKIKTELIKTKAILDDISKEVHALEEKLIGAAEILELFNSR
jgi:hypothetical protein